MAVSHRTRNTPLEESAFPPLSTPPAANAQKPNGIPKNSMAENLRRQNQRKVNVVNTGPAWPAATRFNNNQPSSSSVSRTVNTANTSPLVISGQRKSTVSPIVAPPSNRISHSTSAPNLIDASLASDFPPVSSLHSRKVPENGPSTKRVEEVYAANKSMVEKIRAGLGDDQEKYSNFKEVSAQYRQGVMDAETYLVYVDQFGLSHLVLDLARLLPDPQKEKELIAVYNANRAVSGPKGNDRKNKGKSVVNNGNSSNKLADNILSTVRELQSNYRLPPEEVEILSKDGYRATSKGKSKVEVDDRTSPGGLLVINPPKSERNGDDGEVKGKQQRKKTSKFLRARLGNGSLAEEESGGNEAQDSNDGVPVRGVWRNGGGHRLIGKDQKRP
ncbi:hypothetical protein SSX86_010439 [Deinandra increscens subsp. villosa]|uniref:ZNF598/HEL2 PAH domain-containing protein n=1 Tax=Deinandra increscens subsp. villosa TaxID=3103831 RepID=A0AAP0DBT4_9ASTR